MDTGFFKACSGFGQFVQLGVYGRNNQTDVFLDGQVENTIDIVFRLYRRHGESTI
jgi:hypothetical protein